MKNILQKGSFIILLFIFCGSTYFLISEMMEYKKGNDIYDSIAKMAEMPSAPSQGQDGNNENTSDAGGQNQAAWAVPAINFEELTKINEDIIGWLAVENTNISYPLLKSKDNQDYLKLAANKVKNNGGSIFLDCRNQVDFKDQHTIIYGHNMKNGSMFGGLKQFVEGDYWKNHSRFYIIKPEGALEYEVFSAYQTRADSAAYVLDFSGNLSFAAFVDLAKEHSQVETSVSVSENDRIVTLSTCTNKEQMGRYVVHGKLVNGQ